MTTQRPKEPKATLTMNPLRTLVTVELYHADDDDNEHLALLKSSAVVSYQGKKVISARITHLGAQLAVFVHTLTIFGEYPQVDYKVPEMEARVLIEETFRRTLNQLQEMNHES